jgi:hypothetical protein
MLQDTVEVVVGVVVEADLDETEVGDSTVLLKGAASVRGVHLVTENVEVVVLVRTGLVEE